VPAVPASLGDPAVAFDPAVPAVPASLGDPATAFDPAVPALPAPPALCVARPHADSVSCAAAIINIPNDTTLRIEDPFARGRRPIDRAARRQAPQARAPVSVYGHRIHRSRAA
jgi:hypothetical protein